ncbi:MAG: ABC transporter ATP-binding protein [Thermodesulfovibrionia bacterium]|nr:ABC transporter ATP-binding protein [Thermodesulfovibrionia bacterium]
MAVEPLIKIKNISKTFSAPGGDLTVLKDVSFEVKQGEMTAIMGPSGAGKSTLLHILGALDRPTSGSLHFEGADMLSLSNDALAHFRNKTVGFVFQFHHLLPEFNSIENVIMPALIAGLNREAARVKAEEVLRSLGLSKRLLHKPGELSGGEQQRVAVARALMLDPKVVLADEPTGNLDTQTGEELFNLLIELNKKGITFIIVTHNEILASRCGRIISMCDGVVV